MFQHESSLTVERDEDMANNLWRASQQPGSTTVAVVGAAHVRGIRQHFGHTTDARFDELSQVPAEKGGTAQVLEKMSGMISFSYLAPFVAARAGYNAALRRYSPRVARCGLLGVGASFAAATLYATQDSRARARRVHVEMSRFHETTAAVMTPAEQPSWSLKRLRDALPW